MRLVKPTVSRHGIFQCDICKTEVEKRLDSGHNAATCGSKECQDSVKMAKNKEKYANSFMDIVEDIGMVKNKGHIVKYQCPHCDNQPILQISKGYKQQTCGAAECKFKASTDHSVDKETRMSGMEHLKQLKSVWNGMQKRCYNKKDKNYKYYGAKGIEIEWSCFDDFKEDMFTDYRQFRTEWMENGAELRLSPEIDREDSARSYCKDNCRWISKSENATRKNDEYNPVYQLDGATRDIIKLWDSARDAARIVSKIEYVDKIKNVCNGLRNEHQGFVWRWKDEYDSALAQTDTGHPMYNKWFKEIVQDCSQAWKSFSVFSESIRTTGAQLIKVNRNEPWSESNFRWESADYVRKDMGAKKVEKIDKSNNEVINVYNTIKEAVEDTDNAGQANISACCAGRRKTHAGFAWRYAS